MSQVEQLREDITQTSLAGAGDFELEQVRQAMTTEQAWLKVEERFATDQDVLQAVEDGKLELVGETDALLPIATLRVESNFGEHQPYLRPKAATALKALGFLASLNLYQNGVRGEIRFPITSMVRSEEKQARLAAIPGKLAIGPDESGHPTGWDVDLDSSSYYLRMNGQWVSVSRRDPKEQRQIAATQARTLDPSVEPTVFADPSTYDARVRTSLHEAVAAMTRRHVLMPVVEHPNTRKEVIHIGINPAYR